MPNKQTYLSALGIINPLGSSKSEIFENLIKGDISGMIKRHDLLKDKSVIAGSVLSDLPPIPKHLKNFDMRCNQLLLAAYLQIQNEVAAAIKKYGKNRIAVIIGCGTSGIDEAGNAAEYYNQHQKHPQDFNFNFLEIGTPAKFLKEYLNLDGIFYSVSTACSSSAKAFVSAQNLINLDLCDAVLVGGCDTLCKLTIGGFDALEAMSDELCNPMSKNRKGINLGEGAALFLLTKEKTAIQLLGIGESSDAYHITAPDPTGNGAITAITNALNQANLTPKDIDYINLHGTATNSNDEMESLVIATLFKKTKASSTKPLTGHNLGSAGITELGLCWLLLSNLNKDHLLPPHIWDRVIDENLPKLNLVKKEENKASKLKICLSNSFAFGGSNSVIIIGSNDK